MLRPCPHREIIPGPLASPADCEQWGAALAAEGCAACDATPAPRVEPVAPLPLPADVAAVLAQEGRAGARSAQQALDALGVGAELYPAIVARLSEQPGTCVGWRRWWAGWREGALLHASPA